MSTIDFVHCNKCLFRPKAGVTMRIFITSCFHLFCEKCINEDGIPCKICNKQKKSVELKRDVDPRILNFFQDPQKLLAGKLEELLKKHEFQMGMMKNLTSTFKKQRERLMQLTEHAQKFAAVTKEKDKEIADLKEWCSVAEGKIKELEAQKEEYQNEMQKLRQLETRINSNPFEATFLFDQQNTQTPFVMPTTFDTADSNTFRGVDFTEDVTSSPGIQVIEFPPNSPSVSNSSIVSEITTPKLMGLIRNDTPEITIFEPMKNKTPARAYNPYLDVVNKNKPASVKQSHHSPFGSHTLKMKSQIPKPGCFTPNTVISDRNIIPKVNTPSHHSFQQ